MGWRTVRHGAAPRSKGRDRYLQHPPGEISGEVVSIPKQSQKLFVGCQMPRPYSGTVEGVKAQFKPQNWRTEWEPVGESEQPL